MGFFALISDHRVIHHVPPLSSTLLFFAPSLLHRQECGKQFHLWKYGLLNLVLWVFTIVSYIYWQAGGEGARARGP